VTRSAVHHDLVAVAAIVAGPSGEVPAGGVDGVLAEAVRRAAQRGTAQSRITIDGLVEAAGKVNPDDVPILGMLVHGTSPADVIEVLRIDERELAGRRRRMLKALLGSS
jgi:hypothetical protein